jgi:multidrug transporter EmrE-like cation transporter
MFNQFSNKRHLIMQAHYKMKSSGSEKGIVFGALEVLIIAIEATSMAFLRKSVLSSAGGKWAMIGVGGYAIVAMIFREVLKFAPMAKANALWDAGSIVLVTIVGKFVYGETYTSLQWLGVAFAVAAVLCMVGPDLGNTKI